MASIKVSYLPVGRSFAIIFSEGLDSGLEGKFGTALLHGGVCNI